MAIQDRWKSDVINAGSDDVEVYYEPPKSESDPPSPNLEHDHVAHAPSVNVQLPKPTPRSGICIASLVVGGLSILLCWIPIIGIMAMPLYWLGLLLGGAGLIVAFVGRNENGRAYALIGAVLSGGAWYMGSIHQRVVQRVVVGDVTAVNSTFNTVDRFLDAVGNANKSISDSWEASKKKTEARERAEKEKEREDLAKASEKTAREERENLERLAREKAEREEAQYRTWTSARGRFTTKAKLLGYANGTITIETREHKKIQAPLEKLSRADQEFVSKWRRQLESNASK